MRTLALVTLAALVAAGCVSAPAAEVSENAAADVATDALEPVVQELTGVATASALAPLAHQDPQSERLVMPLHREGFILDIEEVPTMLQIELEWTGTVGGEMLAMVNVPTDVEGKVVDYFSEWSDSGLACMRLPVEELQAARISLMAHSRNAVDVEYTIRITTLGGLATLLDEPHMEVERSDPVDGEALPCETAEEDA